jgi:DNA polymerase alpha subunit B
LRFGNGVKVRGGSPGVKGFGVFAGCLVGLKGRNGGGGVFVVEEVMLVSFRRTLKWLSSASVAVSRTHRDFRSQRNLQPPPADMPSTSASQLLRYQHDLLNGEPTSVIVAAGPYTLDSDLLFEPLEALLEAAKNDRPDVLILVSAPATSPAQSAI